MPFDLRNAFVGDPFPENRVVPFVQTVDAPAMLRVVGYGADVAVQADKELRVVLAPHRRGHENAILPNDGA